MRLSRILPALLVFLAIAGGIGYKVGLFDHILRPIVVAVVDTGVDTRIPAISSRLHSAPGYNFFDGNENVLDENGHGTKVALMAVQNCGSCKLLPLKVSRSGAGVRVQDLAAAIRYAIDKGARVINVSFGLSEGSPDLEKAIAEARSRNVIIVTAAGGGVANPFRAEPLEKVYPQTYPDVLVVGAARAFDDIDLLMNYGDQLDVVIMGQPPETFSSSMAAGTVSGYVAQKLKAYKTYNFATLRAILRATATAPALAADVGLTAALSRLGFGAFNGDAFLEMASAPDVQWNAYHLADASRVQLELSTSEDVEAVSTEVTCADAANVPPAASIKSEALKKGRARVVIERARTDTSLKDCKSKVRLTHPGGKTQTIEAPLSS